MECQYIIDYRFIKDKYKSIEGSLKYINTKLSIDKKDFQAHLMKGLYYFWFERNIKKAKIEINLCNGWEDKRWMYSRAFLYAYDGDLNEAYNSYKKVFRGTTGDNVPLDVVEFIDDILEIEPDKFQLNYCLGLIYFKYIKDYYLAKQYFEKFLKRVEIENKFNDQLPYVLKWLKIIEDNNK